MRTVALVGRETCNNLLWSVVHANAFEYGRGNVLGEENDILVLLIEYLYASVEKGMTIRSIGQGIEEEESLRQSPHLTRSEGQDQRSECPRG